MANLNTSESRPWFKKKRYLIPALLGGGFLALGAVDAPVAQPVVVPDVSVQEQQRTVQQKNSANTVQRVQREKETPAIKAEPRSDVRYYTNVSGERVQSPTHYNSAPAGASAQCRDGTYSFSKNRRGTCSGHGGVAQWL